MGIRTTINLANHQDVDGKWCSCGELVKDCYYLSLIGPAYDAWQSRQYADIFSALDDGPPVR